MQQEMRKKRVVGFDCDFVSPPPEGVQTECPICLLIIREPYQVTCCGKKFCQTCIDSVKTTSKPCPTCKTEEFSYFPDKGLKQSLYTLKVHCSHQREGCEWRGELKWLDTHLNQDPQPGKKFEGCPLATISCDFHHVGCTEKLLRKDILGHMGENIHTHLSLIIAEHSKIARSNDKLVKDHERLKGDYTALALEHTSLSDRYKQLESTCSKLATGLRQTGPSRTQLVNKHDELRDYYGKLKLENDELKSRIAVLELTQTDHEEPTVAPPPPYTPTETPLQRMEIVRLLPTDIFTMENVTQHKKNNTRWFSPPVYLYPAGYRISFAVIANGSSQWLGTHVSILITFLKGEHDDYITWPFRGCISVQMVDQTGEDHKTYTVVYGDNLPDDRCSHRGYSEEIVEGTHLGWGTPAFYRYSELTPRFLVQNTLKFRISGGEAHL